MLEILSLQFQPDLCQVNLPTVQFNIMGLALYHPYHPHSYQEMELQPFMIIHSVCIVGWGENSIDKNVICSGKFRYKIVPSEIGSTS